MRAATEVRGRPRVGRRAWLPRDLPLCKLWLRADVGVVLNGANVSQWTDLSGCGLSNNFVQATALNQPLYVASNINGQPGLRFNGTSHLLTGPAGGLILSTTTGYLFAVVRPISVTLNSATVYANDGIFSDSGADFGLALRSGQGLSGYNYAGSYASTTYQAVSTGTAYAMGWDHQGGTLTTWLGSASQSVASGNTSSFGTTQLGACQSIRWANMDVAEVVAGKAALSAADRTRLLRYFAARYGVSA